MTTQQPPLAPGQYDQPLPAGPEGQHGYKDAKAQAKAAKAYAKAQRPWYKKKRFILPLLIVAIIVAVQLGSGGGDEPATTTGSDTSSSAPATDTDEGSGPAVVEDTAGEPADEPAEPEFTVSQENAIQAAKNYLDYTAFSRQGLIQQLSSKAGDGFPRADAVFAVNHITVDWNQQAAKAAKNYLDFTSFSRAGLIQQLESKSGDGYTHAQAVYGVNQTGL